MSTPLIVTDLLDWTLSNGLLPRCEHGFVLYHDPDESKYQWVLSEEEISHKSDWCFRCHPSGLPIVAGPSDPPIEQQIIAAGFGNLVRKFVGTADQTLDTASGWEGRFTAALSTKWKLIEAAGKNKIYVEGLKNKNPSLSDAAIENILRCSYVKKMFQHLIAKEHGSGESAIIKSSCHVGTVEDEFGLAGTCDLHGNESHD